MVDKKRPKPKLKSESTPKSGRRKQAAKAKTATERRTTPKPRRTKPPKRRLLKEKREDMQIIASASQEDIYTWAISLAIMAAVLGVIITLAAVKGG